MPDLSQRSFTFHPTLVLRTPTRPFNSELAEEKISEYVAEPYFAEALYIASPTLYQQSQKWLRNQMKNDKEVEKLKLSIINYLNRQRSRCTPFGLFASNSVLDWGEKHNVILGDNTRCSRLDMSFLRGLMQYLSSHRLLRLYLRYYANSSLYTIGNEVRYVEYTSQEEKWSYQISSVVSSPELTKVLTACKDGLSYHEVVTYLTSQKINASDATTFVDELIESQLLVSELEPIITGKDPLDHIQQVLNQVNEAFSDAHLELLAASLKSISRQLVSSNQTEKQSVKTYQAIAAQIEQLKLPLTSRKLFQVNAFRAVGQSSIDRRWQHEIEQAIEVLTYFSIPSDNQSLESFKQQFYERYEEEEMPLLPVLDTETGIGYGDVDKNESSSLIEGLTLTDYDQPGGHPQGMMHQWLYKQIKTSQQNAYSVIQVKKKDIKSLPAKSYVIPPSTSAIFRYLDQNTLYLEGLGGASAANLLGRFSNDSPEIYRLAKDIATTEQKNNPDVVFAEIVHLPNQNVGNILRRSALYYYELPYLAQSSLPRGQQIALQDLYVSIRKGRIVLRSKHLSKEIIPRLSTAHNYTYQSLPVYRFLCDLQTQGMNARLSLLWHPEHYQQKRLPRLIYNHIVLGLATWYLSEDDLQGLYQATPADIAACFMQFKKKWALPRRFILVNGDQELLVDTDNWLTVKAWIEIIRKQRNILLKEFLFNPEDTTVVDAQNYTHTSQFIASLIKTEKAYLSTPSTKILHDVSIQRTFVLGSEWLYYKFYSGTRSSDKILLEAIQPLVEVLMVSHQIDQWFFIRYADPNHHLRVRFHLRHLSQLDKVISIVNEYIQPFEASGHIWKSHTDTYRREIERYGTTSMKLSEALFFADSIAVLDTLNHTQGDITRSERWLTGIATVDGLLTIFGYDCLRKHRLTKRAKDKFYQEFGVNKLFKHQIDVKYRGYRDRIAQSLQTENDQQKALDGIVQNILLLQRQAKLEVTLDALVSSYIHMHINRLVSTEQRLHELMIYDFLTRHYESKSLKS